MLFYTLILTLKLHGWKCGILAESLNIFEINCLYSEFWALMLDIPLRLALHPTFSL